MSRICRPTNAAIRVLLVGCLCFSLPAQALGLNTVYELARAHDPVFLASQAVYRADDTLSAQAWSDLLPKVTASASSLRDENDVSVDDGPTTESRSHSSRYSIDLTQPLFDAESFSGLLQARAEVRRARFTYQAAQQDLIARTVTVYFDVLRAEEELHLNKAEHLAIGKQLELANARLSVGLAAITEVHEARAQFELAEATAIEAKNDLQDALEALREMTGQQIMSLNKLSEEQSLDITLDPPQIDLWLTRAQAQNPELRATEAEVEAAKENISRERAGHFPTVDFIARESRNTLEEDTAPNTETRTDSRRVGIELNLPLIQGGRVLVRTKQARYLLEVAQQRHEQQRRKTRRDTYAAFRAVNSGIKKVNALQKAVIASQSTLEARQEGFDAGLYTNKHILEAQSVLYRTKRNLADERYDTILYLLALKQASGILTEKDIIEVNAWLK